MVKSSEVDMLITQDGTSYMLGNTANRFVLSDEGSGMPDIEYITQRGPFQDGETVRDFFLRPRVLQWHIRQKYCSRGAYWSGRNELLSVLAPNRSMSRGQPQATLRRIRGDGSKRDIKVVIEQGPVFQPRARDVWDEWAIDEVIRFIAHDPTYYDPALKTHVFEASAGLQGFPYDFPIDLSSCFIFPITFPVIFGCAFDITRDIVYPGTWLSYPTFVITGPSNYTKIINETTGESLIFTRPILQGQVIVIELAYGAKRVYDLAYPDVSLIGYLTTDSDLASWHLEPRVTNAIRINAGAAGQSTVVTMTYYERYIGV